MTESERLAEFEARIERGEKIEADDWMPDEYRQAALRLIKMHANSELMGALPEREWIPRAPTLKRKLAILAKVQDEVGHAQLIYRVAEDLARPLGIGREDMLEELVTGRARFHNVFTYPAPTWADAAIIAWLVDGAAIVTQGSLVYCSYAPYCRILERICAEEAFHIKHGESMVMALAEGTREQRRMLQEALDRWWTPLIHFFGMPDEASPHTAKMLRWRLKTRSNEEQRQKFLTKFVPAIQALGLRIPDPTLHYDEQEKRWKYHFDWAEFNRILHGEGPLQRQRLNLRLTAFEQTRWVREALAGRALQGVA